MSNQNLPIGVFDSGVGGLTVLKTLMEHLPQEDFLYLGDTARLPYGTKSQGTVTDYAMACGQFLSAKGIKLLVVACNTASSVAIEALQVALSPIPVIGVVQPGAIAGVKASKTGNIAVLATESTVKWHAYRDAILKIKSNIKVEEWPCSLLVSLAEEGWTHGELVEAIIRKILTPMLVSNTEKPDTVVLGCTHFPVLKNAIRNVLAPEITIIDSALSTTLVVEQHLLRHQLFNPQSKAGESHFMATDNLNRFKRMASLFLNKGILNHKLELVDVHLSAGFRKNLPFLPESRDTKEN